jgi:hypothetical protein
VRYLATLLGGDSETALRARWSPRRDGTLDRRLLRLPAGGAAMGQLFSIPSSLLRLRLSSKE